MSDERLREAYERGLASGGDRPPLDDVSAERLRRLVEREGGAEDRLRTLDTLLSTAEGRRDLEIVWGAARAARPRRTAARRWVAAAGVVLAVGLAGTWMARPSGEPAMRGDASPITLVAPLGTRAADEASRFLWRAVPGAERYMLVVVDSAGDEIFAAETRDTMITIPDSVRLEVGRSYLWWVQAAMGAGASVTAVTQRVTITSR